MNTQVETALHEIGRQLDANIFPKVKNGGIVMPIDTAIPLMIMGEENSNERRKRQNRPETRQRKRATRRQGETRGCGKTSAAAPDISPCLQKKYMGELSKIKEAYPGIQIWEQKDGMWLLCQSTLLHDALHSAEFICAIPFDPLNRVRGWGFWSGNTWIGARHTNVPDGSICAFEPSDGTWVPGDSIVHLLDLYTLWAVRHLHLRTFNRWPGAQVAHYPFERIMELKEDELCGCGSLNKRYGDCCKLKDIKRDRISDATKFIVNGWADRKPPEDVMRFMSERDNRHY